MSGQFENQSLGFAFTNSRNANEGAKLFEDRYEVYVNSDFVGYKTLLNQNDTLTDVDDYLKNQGIGQFQSTLDGDHYHIQSPNGELIKGALNVYLHNR
jgi:hypothetical protein